MKTHIGFVLSFLIPLFVYSNAEAFRLEPMVANFNAVGEGSTRLFRVENEAKEKIAVKIQAYTRQIDENGKEILGETHDFKIYPEQITLAASDSRAIRVIYIGKKNIEQEGAYRIIASQLPVNFKNQKKRTGINFLFQFIASVYVTSEKYYPKIEVESISRIDKDNLKLNLINRGQKHTLLKNVTIELKDNGGKVFKLGNDIVKNWDSENILSGTRRTFKLKTPFNFDIQKNKPSIEIKDEI